VSVGGVRIPVGGCSAAGGAGRAGDPTERSESIMLTGRKSDPQHERSDLCLLAVGQL